MVRVLLVDDHALFRSGMRAVLERHPEIEVVGECKDGESAVDRVRSDPPDVVLMDLHMPGIGGIEATRRILHANADVRVIALTMLGDDPFPMQLLDVGARGYVSKDSDTSELLDAIMTVAGGGHYLSRAVAQRLTLSGFRRGDNQSVFDRLSPREMQIMMMIVDGQRNQEISDRLFLSPKTVSTHRHRLFEKLGVSSDVELTRLAMRYGLLEPGK